MWQTSLATVFLVVGVADIVIAAAPVKCCAERFVLSDDLTECVEVLDALDEIGVERVDVSFNDTLKHLPTCFQDANDTSTANVSCVDFQKNGSLAKSDCSEITSKECDSVFTFLHIYGASMMIFANIIYLITYVIVCLMYLLIPGICRRAYDKSVLSFMITQAILSSIVITLGHFMLCHKALNPTIVSLIGIGLMAMTIGSVLWLLTISVDVASTITRLRWAPNSGAKGRDENHKFQVYLTWVGIGTLLPTSFSAILEFLPLSEEMMVKPRFYDVTSVNYRVIVHVATVPTLVAVASSVLFVYTTVRMIRIQKSTSVANENRKKNVKEKYILYLKLYLLMDAPYVTGALGSIYEDLWILKFCRMMQPIIMLYAVFPRHVLVNVCSCGRGNKDESDQAKAKPAGKHEP